MKCKLVLSLNTKKLLPTTQKKLVMIFPSLFLQMFLSNTKLLALAKPALQAVLASGNSRWKLLMVTPMFFPSIQSVDTVVSTTKLLLVPGMHALTATAPSVRVVGELPTKLENSSSLNDLFT